MSHPNRRSWIARVGIVAFFTAAGLVAQRGLLPHLATHVYDQVIFGNDSLLHVWTIAWGQHALATDPLHVFDGNIFFPNAGTLLYSDHLLGLTVLLAPLRLVTDNVVLVHNVAVVAAPILSALAMYALVVDLTAARAAGLVAGLLYGFAPVRFEADRAQIQMLAAWWLPLMLLYARRAIVGGGWRPALAAGLALLLQGLTGIYLTAFFVPFLALAHVHWLGRHPLATHRRGWLRLVLAETAAVALLIPTALTYRHVQAATGTTRSPVLNAVLAVRPSSLPEYLPGWTLGMLLVLALLLARRAPAPYRGEARLFAAITLGALVLALGPSITLPWEWGSVRGPYALLVALPGFTALRTPGRMIHVALVGAAALSGGAVAALTARLGRGATLAITALILAAMAIESRTPIYSLTAAPPPPAIDPAYAWLAAQAEPIRLVELPIRAAAVGEQHIQYASTWHWKPILNGNMGILPPAYTYMRRALAEFPAPRVLGELRALGVTHVLVHEHGFPPRMRERIDEATRGRRPFLEERFHVPGSTIYAIRADLPSPHRVPAGRPLDRRDWRVSATEDATGAARAIDDDPTTAWRSWGTLEDRMATHWYDPSTVPAQWDAFVSRQPARLAIDLGSPHDIEAVVIDLAGSDPMAPPAIRVEHSIDGEHWDAFPAFLVPIPNARALVDNPTATRYALLPPRTLAARHVRLVSHGFEWLVRDLAIHVP